jgi:ferric-dicitrate binding protein FerR (iron transport regulator)
LTRFLAGELGIEEQKLVKEWIDSSDKNRNEFDELQNAWNAVDKTSKKQEINTEKEWKYHQRFIQPADKKRTSILLNTVIRIAAAIIIGIGVTLIAIKYNSQYSVKTKIAETTEIELPDGSKVTLNAGSKISYNKKNYGKEDRVLQLRGEGYFVVEKDFDRPFIIQLDKAEVKVLGTSFNVRAYKKLDAIEVTVSEGKVSLYDKTVKQKQVIATKGEKAEFDKQLEVVKKYPNTDRNYKSWKTRNIVFQNDSLSVIIGTLENVYHKNIILENSELNGCTITTSFENEDLSTVLKVLQSTLDLDIREEKNEIIISGEGC